MKQESNMPRKGTRRAAHTALTVAIIALVLVVNVLFSFAADHFMWQVDETVTRYTTRKGVSMYSPTEEFLDVVGDLAIPMVDKVNAERAEAGEDPLSINIIFCSERDYVYEVEELRLIQYSALALQKAFPGKVNVSYVNIDQNPSAVQKYKATSATNIYPYQVIFEFGTEYRVCSYNYFLRKDSTGNQYWAYIGEQEIASLLLALTRAASPIAGFITNHGENVEACNALRQLVKQAGYTVTDIDLSREEIPDDCRLLVCYDPVTDFLGLGNDAFTEGKSEIDKLDAFLDNNYSFMLFVDKDTPRLPVLEEWGVTVSRAENANKEIDNYTIRDLNQKLDKDGYTLIADYAQAGVGASITADMRQTSYPSKVVFPNATAIAQADAYRTTHKKADTDTGTPAYSFGQYYRNGVTRYFYDVFTAGKTATAEAFGSTYEVSTEKNLFRLMTLSTEMETITGSNYNSTNKFSNMVVFASTEFASDTLLESASYGNADVLVSTLRAIGREVMPADLELKAFKSYEVDTEAYTPNQSDIVTATVCLTLLPIVVCAIAGVYVNVKRKYR